MSVVPFARRQSRPKPRRPRRRLRRRGSGTPWLPAALILTGVAGYLTADLQATGSIEPPAIRGPGPAATRIVGSGAFRLCGWAARQNCVIDGDTIRYRGEKVRLADIDAPETHEPRCAAERERGRAATRRLVELLNEGGFALRATGGRDEDRYGRKLRMVERDGRSIAEILVAEGLAQRWGDGPRNWCG